MDKNNSLILKEIDLPQQGNDAKPISVPTPLFVVEDDMTSVSRSKLDHLIDMAQDDRLDSKGWTAERVFGSLSQNIFFVCVGAALNYNTLPDYGKIMTIVGIFSGLLCGGYYLFKEFEEERKRKQFRSKMVSKLNEIVQQMNSKKNENK